MNPPKHEWTHYAASAALAILFFGAVFGGCPEADYSELAARHWSDVKERVTGTETVEACVVTTGACYELDAEIANGMIELVYFSNGGRLRFSAHIDSTGVAHGFDRNGDEWSFWLDMNSSIVEEAVKEAVPIYRR